MKHVIKIVTPWLEQHLSPLDQTLFRQRLRQLAEAFAATSAMHEASGPVRTDRRMAIRLIDFLVLQVQTKVEDINALHTLMTDFTYQFSHTPSEKDKKERILAFAAELGANARQLRGDQRAFQRWFGYDTVMERGYRRISEAEYELSFLLDRLGAIISDALQRETHSSGQEALLHHVDIKKGVHPLLVFRGDERVRVAAFRCLSRIFGAMPAELRAVHLSEDTVAFIYRASIDIRQPIWIQTESLMLLSRVHPDTFFKAVDRRLSSPQPGDSFFVRKKAVYLLADHVADAPDMLQRLLENVTDDPSPFVRQALPSVLITMLGASSCEIPHETLLSHIRKMLWKDASPQVRAAGVLSLTAGFDRSGVSGDMADPSLAACLSGVLSRETDAFVLRTALKTCGDIIDMLQTHDAHGRAVTLITQWASLLVTLHQQAEDLRVRRWTALTRERIFVALDTKCSSLKKRLEPLVNRIRPGKRKRIPAAWLRHMDDMRTGRVLSVLSQENFGLGLKRGWTGMYLIRGERFSFRLWRFWYELFSPSPDKRQGFSHMTGRKYQGDLRAPSSIGSEMTQTKVPGEPLFFDTEGGWRPYLPLVDEMRSCSRRWWGRSPIRIFTAEGITEIRPPRYIWNRWRAYFVLTLRFAPYARLRNRGEQSQVAPGAYIAALRRLGFDIRWNGFDGLSQGRDEDPAVSRFFGFGIPFLHPDLWPAFQHYFFATYENSIYELGLFATVVLLIFVGRRLYLGYRVQSARRKIRLVIGGWGTRGKSGVERLKSSVFEALGHGFVNKTTGCEAMFLHTRPFGKTREMFLFRPYDKATIWEHHDLICMTARLQSNIFLWECMALNPALVSILQKHWTRDDYSTITNTYPDHEDIQGPAGYNIPQVMTQFIPAHGHLVTSEEEMKHVLADDARRKRTRIDYTGWLEAGLLTPDVLARFPYEEHPNNIALVVKLGMILGLDADFVLKEMADRVVPDIGALKVFPPASIKRRKLKFVNGMSANERFAALENWRRMGFAGHDPHEQPEVMISSLVNNRADRVSRSRMFASIIAEDLSVDYHFLIGSNLTGLSGMIRTAWERHLSKINLYGGEDDSGAYALQVFTAMTGRLKICDSLDLLYSRLQLMLQNSGCQVPQAGLAPCLKQPEALLRELQQQNPPENIDFIREIATHHHRWLDELNAVDAFTEKIQNRFTTHRETLNTEFKQLATDWFMVKIIVIDDVHATGNRIIHDIAVHTPPGLLNRIMGLQNIKGPGLDYVYTWQAWETCHAACRKLLHYKEADVFDKGFEELVAFQDYNVLCEDQVRTTVDTTRRAPIAQSERYQAGLALIVSNLTRTLENIRSGLKTTGKKGILGSVATVLEAFLDAGDAVRRRKTAHQIYKDLTAERISHERAAMELKKLNKRQKGGWLAGGNSS